MKYQFDDNGYLVHFSSGVVVYSAHNELLLFRRRKFPFLWTIPCGHLIWEEDPADGAVRETSEETGLLVHNPQLIFQGVVFGDQCLGGADLHNWHLYAASDPGTPPTLDVEGAEWKWQPLDTVEPDELVPALQYFLRQDDVMKSLRSLSLGAKSGTA